MKKIFIITILITSIFSLTACSSQKKYIKYSIQLEDAFNTVNSVDVFTLGTRSQKELLQLAKELDNTLINLDMLFNVQDRHDGKTTQLMKVNQMSGIEPVSVDEEVISVIKKAIEMSEKSLIDKVALFDPTIAPVWDLWNFIDNQYNPLFDNRSIIPKIEDINNALLLVDYKKIIIDDVKNTVFLPVSGMKIDLGAVVKGYAADKIKNHLIEKGYHKAVIDIGRNILTLGSYFDKELNDKPWNIAIQTPYVFDSEDENVYFGTLKVTDMTLVTSGVYEKYILDEEGNKYHHILDPRTGLPFDNRVVSITVVTKKSIDGDAYSTTLFSLGLEKGMELINSTEGLDAVWVIDNNGINEVYISSGLEDNFQFNSSVENINYIYKGVYK